MSHQTELGPGREFDLVRAMMSEWGSLASGIGDDAAIVDVSGSERLVVSTDSAVEGVHFRLEWLKPREIAYRATAAALSDLAAMAATPFGILIALCLPERLTGEISALASGIGEAASDAGARIIGGDLSAADQLVVGVTVLGRATHPLLRSGARAGDRLYVTGTLGGPLAALSAWRRGEEPSREARARFAHPVPRLREARSLAAQGASAAIDISDGLGGDLAHIAHASGVRITVDLERVPAFPGTDATGVASSGEEFELAVTSPSPFDTRMFESEFGLPLTEIGVVEAGEAEVRMFLDGSRVASAPGYDHFSR